MVTTPDPVLSEIEKSLLARCANGEDIRSSDRPNDKARTRLKKLGYLEFDWSRHRWTITPDGQVADFLANRQEAKS